MTKKSFAQDAFEAGANWLAQKRSVLPAGKNSLTGAFDQWYGEHSTPDPVTATVDAALIDDTLAAKGKVK